VQNGVLKSFSFLFEYIGEMGRDYLYAVVPMLEDALSDRDLVHRQTACATIKHLALGAAGLGCEDALRHLLNFVWPNIFETSPHVLNAVTEAIDGIRAACGASLILHYLLSGLFHPARRVRETYWRLYNNLYIGAQEGLVAAYPRLPEHDDEGNEGGGKGTANGVTGSDHEDEDGAFQVAATTRRAPRYARTHLELFV